MQNFLKSWTIGSKLSPSEESGVRKGFALIVALLCMSFMVGLILSLSLTVRLQISTTGLQQDREVARQNALLGLSVALGQLQRKMGPDQRVSAPASFLREPSDASAYALDADDPRRYWQGVWDASGKALSPTEATPNESALKWVQNPNAEHLGWLVSGFDDEQGVLTGGKLTPGENGEAPSGYVCLLSEGSVGLSNKEGFVYAPLVDVGGDLSLGVKGNYAYWISDEGQKAPINLVDDRYLEKPASGKEQAFATEFEGSRYSLMAPERVGLQTIDGLEDYNLEDEEMAKGIQRISLYSDAILADPSGDWRAAMPGYFHDLGVNTKLLQVDVKHGGMKKDLSLLFELSDQDFSASPYAGKPDLDRSDNPPNDAAADYTDEFTQGTVSYLYKYYISSIGDNAFVRGPTWDYVRDYYRLSKHYSVGDEFHARPYRPNTIDHNKDSDLRLQGFKRTLVSMYEEAKGSNIGDLNNTVSTVSKLGDAWLNGNQPEQIPRLTRHEVAPVVVRMFYIFSLAQVTPAETLGKIARDESDNPIVDGEWKFEIEPFGDASAMTFMVQPVAVVWNPYNVPLAFNAYKVSMENPTVYFDFSWQEAVGEETVDRGFVASLGDMLNDATPATDAEGKTLGDFRDNIDFLIGNAPDGADPVVLKPGELKLFTPQQTAPVQVGDVITHREAFFLEPGWNPTGGLVFYRTLDTVHRTPRNGGIETDNIPLDSSVTINDIFWGDRFGNKVNDDVFSFKWYDFLLDDALLGKSSIASGGNINSEDFLIRGQAGTYKRPSGLSPHAEFNSISGQTISPIQVAASPNQRYPFMAIEIRLNPAYSTASTNPDDGIPLELLGQMNPFGILGLTNHSGFTVPGRYQLFVHSLNGEPSLNFLKPELSVGTIANTLFGYSYSNSSFGGAKPGSDTVVLEEVPTASLWSLGSLQHVNTSLSCYEPRNAIGNSRANLFVANDNLELSESWSKKPWYNTSTIVDSSYLLNDALFDSYFFSSLAPGPGEDSVAKRIDSLTSSTFENIKLPNGRFTYMGGSDLATLGDDLKASNGYLKTAANWAVEGGFNVNSTSVKAWKAFLSSNFGRDYEYIEGDVMQKATNEDALFSRFMLPNAEIRDASNPIDDWKSPHGLTMEQIDDLAEQMVEQVKARGPFLSLADFVNRRPGSLDEAQRLQGAISAAIEAAGINEKVSERGVDAYGSFVDSKLYQKNVLDITTAGVPGWLTQADVLTPLAPYISVRSDTFLIRAYGESGNAFDGTTTKAWCEAIVQRLPEYIVADENEAWSDAGNLSPTNQMFGRRFILIGFRWLNETEI
ncbi:hypothetical protein [Cerasicoccus frondis]|uniref:hypothetical protein n=1 Tax=Cerasicoccus frondis TaxID=490090 RepID=UPI002852CBF3|nr:hypothetical protein [Cerasicoccus frondis]